MRFNLSGENRLDSSGKPDQIQNIHKKTEDNVIANKNLFERKMIINNQLNNLFRKNEENHPEMFNFSPNKQASKLKKEENHSEKKNMPVGFTNDMIDFNAKIDINNKFSNSEKKNLQQTNFPSLNYLNCINYNQINNVNNVNKSSQMDNNCFFPINNNFANFNLINSAFTNINQNRNLNMNFFNNYNNYQNFLTMNLNNNLINPDIFNNIQCNSKNYISDSYRYEKCKKPDRTKKQSICKNSNSDFYSNDNGDSNKKNALRNKENLNYQKNFKKDLSKDTNNNSNEVFNYNESPDIIKDKQNKFNRAKQGNKNGDFNKTKKKPFIEREGDWICFQCKNLNFSFRLTCNRCDLTKNDYEKIFKKNSAEKNKLNISSDKNSFEKDISDY